MGPDLTHDVHPLNEDDVAKAITILKDLGNSYLITVVSLGKSSLQVYHMVGFPEEPTPTDLDQLEKELKTHEAFGMSAFERRVHYDFHVKFIGTLN